MWKISFGSIYSFRSYHPDIIIFLNSELKRGHNSVKIWWSVTRFELDLPFMVIYICAKYYLDPSTLSGVIIRTSKNQRTDGPTDKLTPIYPP